MRYQPSRTWVAWVAGLLLTGAASAEVEAGLVAWFPHIKGSARKSGNVIDTVDFKRDLGLPDNNFAEFRLKWKFGQRSTLRFSYCDYAWQGNSLLTRPVTFNGQVYNLGTQVLSEAQVQRVRIGYLYEPFRWKYGHLGFLFDVNGMFGSVRLQAPAQNINERARGSFPLPCLGIVGGITPSSKLDLYADFSGLTAGQYGYLYDAELGAKIRPSKDFQVLVAYRQVEFKGKDKSNFAKFRLAGPVLSASAVF